MEAELLQTTFISLNGMATAILLITEFIKNKLSIKGTLTIVVSYLVALIISIIGFVLRIGMFEYIEWYYIIIYSVSATLMANGLATWGIIKELLTILKLKTPKN
ncbi:hypothetical protein [Rosettibacter firmus]|uniref:hypothetical protein n=1 Tax=Rosettibacter firmus TaxID=3111522 RepID=UPI00336C1621